MYHENLSTSVANLPPTAFKSAMFFFCSRAQSLNILNKELSVSSYQARNLCLSKRGPQGRTFAVLYQAFQAYNSQFQRHTVLPKP